MADWKEWGNGRVDEDGEIVGRGGERNDSDGEE